MTQQCRSCGCSNLSSCVGGCWWVDDDLCSNCGVAVDVATGDGIAASELPGSGDLIRDQIEELLARLPEGVVPETFDECAGCGCTDDRACPGGCYWVAEGLCSSCVADEVRS